MSRSAAPRTAALPGSLPAVALWLALAVATPTVQADVYIVGHAAQAQRSLTHKEALDLFMGRSRAFATGEPALLFDLPRSSPVRTAFYLALTGMQPAQVNSYWSRLMFSGQTLPPQAMPDEKAMVDIIKRNPSALGYLGSEPTDKALRTLLVLKDGG